MNKFKVGDRVSGYETTSSITFREWRGDVVEVVGAMLRIQYTDLADGTLSEKTFHYKQCRRLIKKKRREIWVNLELMEFSIVQTKGWIRFREVKE